MCGLDRYTVKTWPRQGVGGVWGWGGWEVSIRQRVGSSSKLLAQRTAEAEGHKAIGNGEGGKDQKGGGGGICFSCDLFLFTDGPFCSNDEQNYSSAGACGVGAATWSTVAPAHRHLCCI